MPSGVMMTVARAVSLLCRIQRCQRLCTQVYPRPEMSHYLESMLHAFTLVTKRGSRVEERR